MTKYLNPTTRSGGATQIIVGDSSITTSKVSTGMEDAPYDDVLYGRLNGGWEPFGGGAVNVPFQVAGLNKSLSSGSFSTVTDAAFTPGGGYQLMSAPNWATLFDPGDTGLPGNPYVVPADPLVWIDDQGDGTAMLVEPGWYSVWQNFDLGWSTPPSWVTMEDGEGAYAMSRTLPISVNPTTSGGTHVTRAAVMDRPIWSDGTVLLQPDVRVATDGVVSGSGTYHLRVVRWAETYIP